MDVQTEIVQSSEGLAQMQIRDKIRSKERTAEQSEEEHMTIVDVDVDVRAMMHAEMDWGCSWSPGRGAG